jgi:hypothetical protein
VRLHGPLACCLLLAGCATAHPDFERRFNTGAHTGRPHDLWMVLLERRYGCDTVMVNFRQPQQSPSRGMSVCDLASVVRPEVVRAWRTPPGLREEWLYHTRGAAQLSTVFLEGPTERELRVTNTAR